MKKENLSGFGTETPVNTHADALLSIIRSLGITVAADGTELVIRPASKLTPELRASLRAAKPELLELLQTEQLCQNLDTAGAVDEPAERPPFEARARPVSEDLGRRKAMAHDILAGIAASSAGDFIDPANFDDFNPADVAGGTARLLDRQTADNQARWEAGRGARSAPDGPENIPLPEAADTQPPSHPVPASPAIERHAYRQAERAKREQDNPRAWRFGLGWLARDFLIQNDAWEWLARPTRVRPGYSVHSWPFDQIPDAPTLDALYAELWDEIEHEGRYRGP